MDRHSQQSILAAGHRHRGAVLDACILVPMYLRDTLLRAAERQMYQPIWSALILEELRRNLVGIGHVTEAQAAHLVVTMQRFFPDAMAHDYERLIPLLTNHPKDRHVLAVAVQARAHSSSR